MFLFLIDECFIHGLPYSLSTPVAQCTNPSWCYHMPSCSDVTWDALARKECNGTQQSPIDIVTANVQADANLTSFNFTGYDDNTTLTEIENTGKTIKVTLDDKKMYVEGGDLPGLFTSTQFHLHWGNGSAMPGSEHTVDGKRYPMELHIVNKAVRTANVSSDSVLAAFGFFIEASNATLKPKSWKTLTSYLAKIANAGAKMHINHSISMDDLLPGMDRTKYYRYLGSLTTPNCKEGVVWTVFKNSIKVSQDLIDLFSAAVYINTSTNSPLMTYTFRGVRPINSRFVTSHVAGGMSLFHIVDRNVKSLLGLPESMRLNLIQLGPGVHTVQQQAHETTDYKDLFRTDTVGKLPVVYHMGLDESVHPTVCAPRRIPLAMKDKVAQELERMTRLGIISPVEEATPWVSAMAAAVKKDVTVHICIDPVHLNMLS
ncbi:carbonic anhydrase 4-like [Myxocyprinus asiaticus]|uniref:carbonic anhydrase 4-like n=1 Tax=Myxocyprinus asiaticus TaxID=70543 RepID=UPI002221F802|nr:carbonic anhydrase 4-like [Myxocyprinus asiaticus]